MSNVSKEDGFILRGIAAKLDVDNPDFEALMITADDYESLKAENERLKVFIDKKVAGQSELINHQDDRINELKQKIEALQSKIERVREYCGNPARGGVSLVDPFVIRGLLK